MQLAISWLCLININPRTVILAGVPRDPIVSTEGPAAIECIRTKDHRKDERKMASTHK